MAPTFSIIGLLAAVAAVIGPASLLAQALTGELICTVKDAQGSVLPLATVRLESAALIGGPVTRVMPNNGHLRFPGLPPGSYTMRIEMEGFTPVHETDIHIGAGQQIERNAILNVAGVAESIVVEGFGSRIDTREAGLGTRFGSEDIRAIPTRRSSMFDLLRSTPGISPTSPSSATTSTVSAFGSGTNENQFLIDGTNFTCPCNGIVLICLALTAGCDGGSTTGPSRPPTDGVPVVSLVPLNPVPSGVGGIWVPAPLSPPRSAADPTVGRYRLDLASGSQCDSFPEVVRTRTYTADFEWAGGSTYEVSLYDATFLAVPTCSHPVLLPKDGDTALCNRFLAFRTEGSLQFNFQHQGDDSYNGNLLYEQLPDTRWLEMEGNATGSLVNGAISARGAISLSYWLGFPGRSSYSVCRSEDLRLSFTRQ